MTAFRAKWATAQPWLAAACVVLTANWAAAELKDHIDRVTQGKDVEPRGMLMVLLYLALFAVTVYWLYRLRKVLFHPRTRLLKNEAPSPREHLILFLSDLDVSRGRYNGGVPEGVVLTGDLQNDLNALVEHKKRGTTFWRWEMPLRAIKPHLATLKVLTVLCSPESVRQVHWFGQILTGTYARELAGVAVEVFLNEQPPRAISCPACESVAGGWKFEAFDALSEALLSLLSHLKNQGVRDEQIMIDFTGGQKVTSVVAASATFNRAIKSQYVQTNPPFDAVSYDILLTHSLTEGMGW